MCVNVNGRKIRIDVESRLYLPCAKTQSPKMTYFDMIFHHFSTDESVEHRFISNGSDVLNVLPGGGCCQLPNCVASPVAGHTCVLEGTW